MSLLYKFQNGGKVKPLVQPFVTSDPEVYKKRLGAYNDSLTLYNHSAADRNWFKAQRIIARDPNPIYNMYSGTAWNRYSRTPLPKVEAAYSRLAKLNKKEPKGKKTEFMVTGVVNGKDDPNLMYSNHTWFTNFKKPQQPVIFQEQPQQTPPTQVLPVTTTPPVEQVVPTPPVKEETAVIKPTIASTKTFLPSKEPLVANSPDSEEGYRMVETREPVTNYKTIKFRTPTVNRFSSWDSKGIFRKGKTHYIHLALPDFRGSAKLVPVPIQRQGGLLYKNK